MFLVYPRNLKVELHTRFQRKDGPRAGAGGAQCHADRGGGHAATRSAAGLDEPRGGGRGLLLDVALGGFAERKAVGYVLAAAVFVAAGIATGYFARLRGRWTGRKDDDPDGER